MLVIYILVAPSAALVRFKRNSYAEINSIIGGAVGFSKSYIFFIYTSIIKGAVVRFKSYNI